MASLKTQKVVQVIARYYIKRNGHVVYTVRSSDGLNTYTTTLVNGKATGCTCPSRKPCYHGTQLEALEAARVPASSISHTAPVKEVETVQAIASRVSTAEQRNAAPLNGNRAFSLLR